MVHADRERDSEKSVPQRSGRESETRRSLLSEIQKFPKRKTSLTNVLRKHSDKHNVESNDTISKRRKFDAIEFTIGYTTSRRPSVSY